MKQIIAFLALFLVLGMGQHGYSQLSTSQITTNVSCNGLANGSVDLTVTGGILPYTYIWSNGATNQDINGLAPGTYTVTIHDSGVSGTPVLPASWSFINTGTNHTILVPYPDALINGVSINVGDYIGVFYLVSGTPTCGGYIEYQGYSDALSAWGDDSMSPAKDGFAANEAFIWKVWRASTGQIVDMTATYDVTSGTFSNGGTFVANGMSGCSLTGTAPTVSPQQSATLSVTVTQPAVLSATVVGTNVTTFGGSNGSVNLTVSGGSAPYAFLWSNGAATEDIGSLVAGTYSVTVTDSHSCTATASATITQPLLFNATISTTNVACNGQSNGSATVTVVGGQTPITIAWSMGGSGTSHSNLSAGSYNVTVSESGGQTIALPFTITQPAILVLTGTATSITCYQQNNGSISTTVTGGSTPYSYLWSNGANSQSLSNLAAGTYTLTLTDSHACVASSGFTITQPTELVGTLTAVQVSVFGGSNGSIDLTPNGGTPPYTYHWNNNAATQDLNGLSAGTYSVTITDFNGCTKVLSTLITQPSQLLAGISHTNVLCNGQSNGSATVSVTSGQMPFGYIWSNGQTTSIISNLAAGVYTATVSDAMGQNLVLSTTVTQPLVISVSGTPTNVTCFGLSNGSLTSTVSGGTSPYSYLWSTGSIMAGISNFPAGTYSLTVTDANSCVASSTFTISQPTQVVVTGTGVTNVGCNGGTNGSISFGVSGGTGPYTYSSNPSQPFTGTSLLNLAAGTYQIIAHDAAGCTGNQSFTVTQPAPLAINGTVSTYPGGGSVSEYNATDGYINTAAAGGTQPFTYAWSNGATTAAISGLGAGSYSLTLTDAHLCSTSASFTILNSTVNMPMSLSGAVTNVLCHGALTGAIDITVTGGQTPMTYLWSNGQSVQDLNGVGAGVYTVTVMDGSGNSGTPISWDYFNSGGTSVILVVFDPTSPLQTVFNIPGLVPSIGDFIGVFYTATGGGLVCGGYSVLDGNNVNVSAWGDDSTTPNKDGFADGEAYQWMYYRASDGATFPMTATCVDPAINPNFFNGCNYANNGISAIQSFSGTIPSLVPPVTIIQAFTITEPPAIVLGTPTVQNVNCFGEINGSISVTVSGGTPPLGLHWSNGATANSLSNLPAGTYSLTVTDSNNCHLVQPITVSQPTLLGITSTVTPVTTYGGSNGSIHTQATGGTSPYSYLWSNGQTLANIDGLTAGTYSLTVTDAHGCHASNTFNVLQPPPPIVATGSVLDALCYGQASGSINLTVSGGVSPLQYHWSNAATTQNISSLLAGTYSVTINDAVNQNQVLNFTVNQPDQLQVVASADVTICEGESTTITVSGTATTFTWNNGLGAGTSFEVDPTTTTTYIVTGSNAIGCTNTDQVTVTVNPLPDADYTYSLNNLVITLTNNSSNATSYSWDFGDGNSSTLTNPSHTFAGNGTYTVVLTATNSCGYDDFSVTVDVINGLSQEEIQSFVISPNPSHNQATIRFASGISGKGFIELMGIDGKLFTSQKVENLSGYEATIDLSAIAPGLYLVRVQTAQGLITGKLIVE